MKTRRAAAFAVAMASFAAAWPTAAPAQVVAPNPNTPQADGHAAGSARASARSAAQAAAGAVVLDYNLRAIVDSLSFADPQSPIPVREAARLVSIARTAVIDSARHALCAGEAAALAEVNAQAAQLVGAYLSPLSLDAEAMALAAAHQAMEASGCDSLAGDALGRAARAYVDALYSIADSDKERAAEIVAEAERERQTRAAFERAALPWESDDLPESGVGPD